jgi:hypothetical protein
VLFKKSTQLFRTGVVRRQEELSKKTKADDGKRNEILRKSTSGRNCFEVIPRVSADYFLVGRREK